MGLTLIVMRHSHAASDREYEDRQRPLTEEGIQLAITTGRKLCDLRLVPDIIVASAAVRTMHTANLVVQQFDSDVLLTSAEELYLARADVYLTVIRQSAPQDASTVMVVGHNPGVGTLMQGLSGQPLCVTLATVGALCNDFSRVIGYILIPYRCVDGKRRTLLSRH